MIPRFKPSLGVAEFWAALTAGGEAVTSFEAAFAATFGARHALAYSYGRSALWAFLRALDLHDAEVVVPAYTCSVVAHAVVLSGNRPRFVDISLDDYTMDLDGVARALNRDTRAVVATHLFGYPMNTEVLRAVVADAEGRYGRKIWIVQDCAHSFAAEWSGRPVQREPDLALFGLNITKTITSIFGGVLTTDDDALAARLRSFRDQTYISPGAWKRLRRLAYLAAVYPAFTSAGYAAIERLARRTPLLNRFTIAYHRDEVIAFPPDHLEGMSPAEAAAGTVQLAKYTAIVRRRIEHARFYHTQLCDVPGLAPAPIVAGATYSHYVARTPNRDAVRTALLRRGIELGQLIEYSLPDTSPYRPYARGQEFPNAAQASRSLINLPVSADLTEHDRDRIGTELRRCVPENLGGRPT